MVVLRERKMLQEILLLLAVFIFSSHQQCFTDNNDSHYIGRSHINAWIASRHNFSVSLLKIMNMDRKRQNILFSPSNIHDALLLAYFGAERETESSLRKVLQIPGDQNKATTWRFYKHDQLKLIWKDINGYPLNSAITLFMSNKCVLRPCIEEKLRRDLEMIDFETDVIAARRYINSWTERRTNDRVKNYMRTLSPHAIATIVNAVYLKSKWKKGFNRMYTQYKSFHVNEYESRKISMMSKNDYFHEGYSVELGARLLLLPYQGNATAMIILLPDHDLDVMIEWMNEDTLPYITDRRNYRYTKLQIYVPKMEYKNEIDVIEALEILGAGDSFTEFADFSGFTGRKDVSINFGDHHAVIEVDEEGTEVFETEEKADFHSLRGKPFVCNRPFAYVVYDFNEQKAIFMGTLSLPQRK